MLAPLPDPMPPELAPALERIRWVGPRVPVEQLPRFEIGYDADGAETPFQNIILGPAGSLDVTAKELAQLVRFFLGRGTVDGTQVLTPDSVARIERSESTLGARVGFASYGYGLGNTPFPDQGVTFRGHNGGIDSFTSVYGYSLATNSGYVLMANGGDGVDIAQPAAQLVQAYLTRNAQPKNEPTVAVDQAQLEKYAGVYRAITPSNRFTRPYQEILGLTWVQADLGKLRISGNDFFPTSQHTFRRADREAPTLAFTEDQGETYKISAFNATQKEPWWRVAVIAGVLGFLALGAVIAVLMSPVWLIAWLRGRLADRGGALVRILPLLSVVALIVTFALPLGYLTSGAIPAALQLAQPGPYAYTIFASSILFPLFAALGLWRALRGTKDSAAFVYTLVLIVLGYSGLGISLWPNIVPPTLTIYDAAGPPQSLGFALVGALLIIPLILMYTAWGYWVFRGKVRRGDGYH